MSIPDTWLQFLLVLCWGGVKWKLFIHGTSFRASDGDFYKLWCQIHKEWVLSQGRYFMSSLSVFNLIFWAWGFKFSYCSEIITFCTISAHFISSCPHIKLPPKFLSSVFQRSRRDWKMVLANSIRYLQTFPVRRAYRRACPGTAVQTGEWGRKTPPGKRGLRTAGTPWPSAMSYRLWRRPRRRSRCLSLWPRPPPPPRGPEDVHQSRWRPRWGPEGGESLSQTSSTLYYDIRSNILVAAHKAKTNW